MASSHTVDMARNIGEAVAKIAGAAGLLYAGYPPSDAIMTSSAVVDAVTSPVTPAYVRNVVRGSGGRELG
jgi:hypothetical protein